MQLAKKAGLFVVGIAGASKDYAKELGADVVVDYREHQGDQLVSAINSLRIAYMIHNHLLQIDALVSAVADHPTPWAFDAIAGDDSALILARALAKIRQNEEVPAHVATVFPVLPEAQRSLFPSNVTCAETFVGSAYGDDEQCKYSCLTFITRG